jgi:hypothetical protein
VDEAVVEPGFFREFARRDAGVADAHEQTFGGVEKGLLGFFARRRDADSLTLRCFDGSSSECLKCGLGR